MSIVIKMPYLTKSKYISGLQCFRKLWLNCHEAPEYSEADPGSILDIGNKIGVFAHNLFPGGVLVTEEAYQHVEAVAQTLELMADEAVPAIFEAAFEYEDVRVRVDILERLPRGAWGIREVKSGKTSDSLKKVYVDDVAVQYHVLVGYGLNVESVELILVNRDFERGPDEISWNEFFAREDLLVTVQEKQDEVLEKLTEQRDVLLMPSAPIIDPYKRKCSKPYSCEYWLDCTKNKPYHWVQRLHMFGYKQVLALKEQKIEAISELPEEYPLEPIQRIERQVIETGEPYISPDIGAALEEFSPPAYYLDFEYLEPVLPLFEGAKPGDRLPFQWSVHYVKSAVELDGLDGEKEPKYHREYLSDGKNDFRRQCAEKLLDALGQSDDPIIVYYLPAENGAIKSLARDVPDLEEDLLALLPRLKDILLVVRNHTCLPGYFERDFSFSPTTYSIKNTIRSLSPGFSYSDLEGVSMGMAAAEAFYRIMTGEFKKGETAESLSEELLLYCKCDTLAMVKAHRALRKLSEEKSL